MAPIIRRRINSKRNNVKRPAGVSLFLALNLCAWLLYLSFASSRDSLRHLNHLDYDELAANDNSFLLLSINNDPISENKRLQARLVQKGVPTVSCSRMLRDARSNVTFDPNQGKLYSRYTVEDPHFYISVHERSYDKVRFEVFETEGSYYERALTDCFRQVLLSSNNKKRVLDVGGNIGWYALLSAAMGAQVATFEPHMPNILRMCESQCLNDWLVSDKEGKESNGACLTGDGISENDDSPLIPKHIHIFPYAVSDENAELNFQITKKSNPGMGHLIKNPTTLSTPIRAVTLDSMVNALGWNTQNIDILKVDVEGAEVGVFLGAKKLLKSNRVLNIFMEGNVRTPSEIGEFETLINLFVDSGYYLYKIGGFSGPQEMYKALPRDANFSSNLVAACSVHSSKQCNLWWKLSRPHVEISTK